MKANDLHRPYWFVWLAMLLLSNPPVARAADDPAVAAVTAAGNELTKVFNGGDVAATVAFFHPSAGELVDEAGNTHQGEKALKELFTAYFKKFPGAKLELETDSIRVIGNSAIEEGTRYLSAKDTAAAQVRYVTVWTKEGGKWLIASTRETYDEPAPELGDHLADLDWLIGDWVSEDSDAAVRISYRWDDSGNYILGDFQSTREGKPAMKSTQRIGYDPQNGSVRSWLFDADGGFAEGCWTRLEDSWVIKSTATMPDGQTGSATIAILPKGKDQFTMKGTERLAGNQRVDDFAITISRAPPSPRKVEAKPAPTPETKTEVAPATKTAPKPTLTPQPKTPPPAPKSPAIPQRPLQGK